jgi:hypothetical protein
MSEENTPKTSREAQRLRDLNITSRVLATAFAIGCIFVWLRFAIPNLLNGTAPKAWITTGQTFTALLWAAAWFAVAFVFGFLFGIPKALQSPSKLTPTGTPTDPHSDDTAGKDANQLKVNTNLEEISDWLTKILVGATLTQLIKIPGAIRNAADFMASTAGGTGPVPFAAAILLYFSAIGFFAGYVMTRMFFSLAFSRFDRGLLPSGFDRPLSSKEVDSLAGQLINPNADSEIKEDGYNSIIYRALYLSPPAGFEKAIQYANEFLGHNTPTRSSIYINLASAYGQQYRYLQENKAADDELKRVRDLAIDAVKKSIQINPESKRRLRELLHPQPGSVDNDLQVFESDKELTDLIDGN